MNRMSKLSMSNTDKLPMLAYESIIFLDIDGVMISTNNIIAVHRRTNKMVPSAIPFDAEALQCLEILAKTANAGIVLSSSWRIIDSLVLFFTNQLSGVNLLNRYIGNTPYFGRRDDEITTWLIHNNFKGNFVIIDDETYDLTACSKNLVNTKMRYGFTKADMKEALDILMHKKIK